MLMCKLWLTIIAYSMNFNNHIILAMYIKRTSLLNFGTQIPFSHNRCDNKGHITTIKLIPNTQAHLATENLHFFVSEFSYCIT